MNKQSEKDPVLFILSVDTEEEWDWADSFPNDNFSLSNINEIPAFQLFCQELGIKPTYFVDYAVADNKAAANILASINKQHCEIGAHLHPWANPPFYEATTEKTSHVVNLPIEQIKAKLELLNKKIEQNIGTRPNSFRTGRWGVNGEILQLLVNENINIDSSVYPLYVNQHFNCEQAPLQPYWPSFDTPTKSGIQRNILEIPVTCGFNRQNYPIGQKIHKLMAKPPFTWIKANGILWHTGLLRKIYLSPELCSAKDMIKLVDTSLNKDQKVLHMYLHSSSLVEGITGLSEDINARESICKRIQEVISYLQTKVNVQFCTISQAKINLQPNLPL